MRAMPSGPTTPSLYRNPAASSKSAPGVRMVTASRRWAGPAASRSSIGSSVATASRRVTLRSPSTNCSGTRVVGPGRAANSGLRGRGPGRGTGRVGYGSGRRGGAFQPDDRVVVGHAGLWGSAGAVDEHLPLRPVHLQVARGHRGAQDPPAQAAVGAGEHDRFAIGEAEAVRVERVDQHGLANGSVERVPPLVHHAVE